MITTTGTWKIVRTTAKSFAWSVSFYVALFYIASHIYQNRVDVIEGRANTLIAQLSTSAQKHALSRIPSVQRMLCPHKPRLWPLYSSFLSLVRKDVLYAEMVDQLKITIEAWKTELEGANLDKAILNHVNLSNAKLTGVYLRRADLERTFLVDANLKGADLRGANLKKALLWKTNLRYANLSKFNVVSYNVKDVYVPISNLFQKSDFQKETDLSGAHLWDADLRGANLAGANLKDADLLGADLRGAKGLTAEQLSKVKTLHQAKLDPELEKEIKEKYPHLLEPPEKEKYPHLLELLELGQ